MNNDNYKTKTYKSRSKIIEPNKPAWRILTQKEKDNIMDKANERNKEALRKRLQTSADIILGKQKTIENSWN